MELRHADRMLHELVRVAKPSSAVVVVRAGAMPSFVPLPLCAALQAKVLPNGTVGAQRCADVRSLRNPRATFCILPRSLAMACPWSCCRLLYIPYGGPAQDSCGTAVAL